MTHTLSLLAVVVAGCMNIATLGMNNNKDNAISQNVWSNHARGVAQAEAIRCQQMGRPILPTAMQHLTPQQKVQAQHYNQNLNSGKRDL